MVVVHRFWEISNAFSPYLSSKDFFHKRKQPIYEIFSFNCVCFLKHEMRLSIGFKYFYFIMHFISGTMNILIGKLSTLFFIILQNTMNLKHLGKLCRFFIEESGVFLFCNRLNSLY